MAAATMAGRSAAMEAKLAVLQKATVFLCDLWGADKVLRGMCTWI